MRSAFERVDLSQDTEVTGSSVVVTLHHPRVSHAGYCHWELSFLPMSVHSSFRKTSPKKQVGVKRFTPNLLFCIHP